MINLPSVNHASSRSRIVLSGRIETTLVNIYKKHNFVYPISDETRQRLFSISEELAVNIVKKILSLKPGIMFNLECYINIKVDEAVTVTCSPRLRSGGSPAQSRSPSGRRVCRVLQEEMSVDSDAPSPKSLQREGNGGSKHIPQLLALGELEFKKAFLLLSYIPGQSLGEVITADEIRQWKDLPMVAYEAAVWDRLGRHCPLADRRVSGQISGNVLVYRNPGLHFGDIHVLKATYVKALEEYVGNSKYAVFFPQKGPRSLGDEIAGCDFDGDMYFISRNPELLEHFKPSDPWVSLSPPSESISGREPSKLSPQELEEELFEMFLKARFHASNVIGVAADSWLTIMDRFLILGDEIAEEKAEMKKKMLQLIDIYYDALDAPKKGAKVYLPYELRPDIFPHYMEREKSFKSTSILGLIYDFVKSETSEEHSPSSEITKLPCFEDEPVSESHIGKCREWYDHYRAEMSQAMNDKGESPKEVVQRYKQEFYGAAGFEESNKSLEELYLEALALYNIVYDYAIQGGASGVSKSGLCGFVWKVAGPVLCRFYQKKTQEKSILCSASVLKELLG